MNRFLRKSVCVAVVLLTGTVLTFAAAVAPSLVYPWVGPEEFLMERHPGVNAALITLLAWFGIQCAAALGERLARRLGLEPRGRDPAPGLLRSTAAFGAGVVSGYVVFFLALTLIAKGAERTGGFAMGAAGTVGVLWARAVLRGGLFAPPPAGPPA